MIPCPKNLAYLPFQEEGIRWLASRKRALLADEMGLGKSVEALGLINADESIRRILVICPATLKFNWRDEARKWLVRKPEIFGIVNYERVRREKTLTEILRYDWDLIIIDEAHKVKERTSQQSRIILGYKKGYNPREPGLIDRTQRLVLLTGTPMLNRPIDLWPLLNAVEPGQWGTYWTFAQRYADAHTKEIGYKNPKTVWDVSGASNLVELNRRLQGCMLRRLKVDVLKDLPEKRRQIIAFECSDLIRMKERFALLPLGWNLESFKSIYAATDVSGLSVPEKFGQVSKARQETALQKIPLVAEHVRDLLDGGVAKVVLFAHHHTAIEALDKALCDYPHVVLYGETPQDDRQGLVDRFQTDETIRVFLGGIQTAGTGLTLHAASVVLFAELDWVPAVMSQAEDRLHRIGQRNPVLVQYLVFNDTIDARIAEVLVEKQEILDRTLGGRDGQR